MNPQKLNLSSLRCLAARYFALAGCCGLLVCEVHGQPAARSDLKFWITDGPVNAILPTDQTVYIGGDFSYVGPPTGPVALFNQGSGTLQDAPAPISGSVKAVVPDGSDGWFIGGSFTRIGNVAFTNIAHLLPDLTLYRACPLITVARSFHMIAAG